MRGERGLDEAQIALGRFGLGPRPGDCARIAGDPRGAVKADMADGDASLPASAGLKASTELYRSYFDQAALSAVANGDPLNEGHKAALRAMWRSGAIRPVRSAAQVGASGSPDFDDLLNGERAGRFKDIVQLPAPPTRPNGAELRSRYVAYLAAEVGFRERLVLFWENHFCVSLLKSGLVSWLVGAYEREAIRPNVFGGFGELLQAVVRHPAMLIYLDNDLSVGPNSKNGQAAGGGLNENLAREVLELHTLGVEGGYTQKDVTAFARALTGWRVERRPEVEHMGAFAFIGSSHEPGDQTILRKAYRAGGVGQAQAALDDLARAPATARHIARKLAVAFVSDDPPPGLVSRLERTFIDTDGDLREVSLALISAEEAWRAPRTKFRSPQEFVVASARAVGRDPNSALLDGGAAALGQRMWSAESPKGYSIRGADWIAPDAQTNRLDLAVEFGRAYPDVDPVALAEDVLCGAISDETRAAVKRAETRAQGLALFLMSPEMQRR